ncbi:MAG: site-specific integrase [Solirubrobacterales bacterium]
MPRQATGYVDSHPWRDGRTTTWRLCIRTRGERRTITLGTNHEGWNEDRAKVELDQIMEQVRRGTWIPPSRQAPPATPVEAESDETETLHVTLSRWWQRKRDEIRPNTQADYRWRLDLLLRFRPKTLTADVDVRWVDELRDWLATQEAKNRRGKSQSLSPRSVNMVLDCLAQALDIAVDWKLLDHNPARGKRRRMRVTPGPRSFLEPDMVVDLLEIAGEWEQSLPEHQRYGRRALLALLCLGGPRISEAILADRGEFDLAGDHWRIPAAKTEAGQRTVELTVFCAEELRDHVAATSSLGRPIGARKPMWPSLTGGRLNPSNVRQRLLREVISRTNDRRAEKGKMLLPVVTPHALRRTFASLCFFAGRDPAWVMGQMGHKDARLTLAVYAQTMQRQQVDRDLVWQLMRFADESEALPRGGRFDTRNDTTEPKEGVPQPSSTSHGSQKR